MTLAEEIYSLTNQLPKEETYGLSSQMRRAAVSIPSNIAEGSKRKDTPEFLMFLRVSDASAAELETQLLLVEKLYPKLKCGGSLSLLVEIEKMLYAMLKKMSEKRFPSASSKVSTA